MGNRIQSTGEGRLPPLRQLSPENDWQGEKAAVCWSFHNSSDVIYRIKEQERSASGE